MLWGECISGALYVNDFLALARRVGFADPRQLHVSPLTTPGTPPSAVQSIAAAEVGLLKAQQGSCIPSCNVLSSVRDTACWRSSRLRIGSHGADLAGKMVAHWEWLMACRGLHLSSRSRCCLSQKGEIAVHDDAILALVGGARFYSITYRLFKLPGLLETACEDYGHVATYQVRHIPSQTA